MNNQQQVNYDVTFVSKDKSCVLPDIFLPKYPSNPLAVNLGRRIYVCGFWPSIQERQNDDRDCYMTENLAGGGDWKKIASRQFSSYGSSYALIGQMLLSTTGRFSDNNKNIFESLDLSVEDSSWQTLDLGMPNLPQDHHLIHSCMVALNDTSFIMIGGHTKEEDSWQVAGGLTQIYNFQTEQWTRMPNLNPRRNSHACMRYLDGVLVSGGVETSGVGGGGHIKESVNFFNLTSSTWQDFSPMNHYRQTHILVSVAGVPTVIGGYDVEYSEQFMDEGWKPWIETTRAVRMAAVYVPSDEFHC